MTDNSKVLFITRKYPPSTGGMENFMWGLISNYPGAKRVIAYGGPQQWLPFVYIWQFFFACGMLISDKNIDTIHAGDGVMAPMVWLLKKLFRKTATLTTYGKDVNLRSPIYQFLVPLFMRQMDYVFPISEQTKKETLKKAICTKRNCEIITPGVDESEFALIGDLESVRQSLVEKYNIALNGRKILLTVGRLSKRKGVKWFSENVMPKLKEKCVYISVGADGTEINGISSMLGLQKISYRDEIYDLLKERDLVDSVYLLGKIPFSDVKEFYSVADVFLMPNISVPGDMEGFGIVNIEAGLMGTPVVASNIEGIPDAVIDGVTGSLVKEGDVDSYIREINSYLDSPPDKSSLRKRVIENYSWSTLSRKYYNRFCELATMKDRPSILYIFPFFTGPYGAERLLSDLVNGLSENMNYKATVLTLFLSDTTLIDSDIQIKTLLPKGVYKLLGHNVVTFISPIILSLYVLFTNVKKYDIVHLLNWQSLLTAPIVRFKARALKLVYHCTEPPRFLYDLKKETVSGKGFFAKQLIKFYSFLIRIWDSRSIQSVDGIVSISEWTEEQIQQIYGYESVVIYPAVETERFDRYSRASARKKLGIGLEEKIYVTVSKLHPRKKLDVSIEFFIDHSKKDKSSKYFIIGGGPDEIRLKKYLEDLNDPRIEMLGRVESDDEVALYLIASDYFIFTAKNEPFGIAPLEAKSAGCEILGVDNKRKILNPEEMVLEFESLYGTYFS